MGCYCPSAKVHETLLWEPVAGFEGKSVPEAVGAGPAGWRGATAGVCSQWRLFPSACIDCLYIATGMDL